MTAELTGTIGRRQLRRPLSSKREEQILEMWRTMLGKILLTYRANLTTNDATPGEEEPQTLQFCGSDYWQ
jgi:hypothetical protein